MLCAKYVLLKLVTIRKEEALMTSHVDVSTFPGGWERDQELKNALGVLYGARPTLLDYRPILYILINSPRLNLKSFSNLKSYLIEKVKKKVEDLSQWEKSGFPHSFPKNWDQDAELMEALRLIYRDKEEEVDFGFLVMKVIEAASVMGTMRHFNDIKRDFIAQSKCCDV